MKTISKNKTILLFALASTSIYSQDWSNSNNTSSQNIFRSGKVGIGTWYAPDGNGAWANPSAALDVSAVNNLGAGISSNVLLGSFSGPTNLTNNGNWIRSSKWLVRTGSATPFGWSGVSVHDGVSVDASFQTPGTSTKTWWERDPSANTQKWGNDNNTYMRLAHGKLSLGTFYDPDWAGSWNMSGALPRQAPMLEMWSQNSLGSNVGNAELINSFSAPMGAVNQSNWLRHNNWILRTATGGPFWSGVSLHDGLSVDASFKSPGTDTKTWWERDPYNGIQSWGNANQTYMTLNQGKLGLGLLTQQYCKLEVQDMNNAEMQAYTTSFNPAGFWVANSATNYGLRIDGTGIGHIVQQRASPLNLISFAWNNSLATPAAQVWIGQMKPATWSAHPDFRLGVDGKLIAKEVIVTLQNWADFVFDKTYKLMPLNELENFYKENHHLPEVPSTKEIIENGNDLGKTDALLLQKIEELTLYIVEQQKQIDELKKITKH
jgi:hypothetical protein